MLGGTIFKYASLVLLIALSASLLIVKYQHERISVLVKDKAKLEIAFNQQSETIKALSDDAKMKNDNINKMLTSFNAISSDYNASLNEINSLRASELKNAIQNPYARGNLATVHINERLQSIVGERNTNTNKSGNDTPVNF